MKTVVIFLNSASFAAAPVFDLPLCTLTDTEGKPESGIYFKIFEITQYLMNTLYNQDTKHAYQTDEWMGKVRNRIMSISQ